MIGSEEIRDSGPHRGGANTRRTYRRSDDDGPIAQEMDTTDARIEDLNVDAHADSVDDPDSATDGVKSVASVQDVWYDASDAAVVADAS